MAQVVAPVIYQRTAGHPVYGAPGRISGRSRRGGRRVRGELAAQVAVVAEAVPSGVQQLIELQLGHLRAEEQDVLAMAVAWVTWSLLWPVWRRALDLA